MRTAVSERIMSWPPSAQRGMRSVCGDRQEAPPTPMASASSPSTPALWDECRQSSALTAGRPGDAQPVSFYSDEMGVAIVAECCMPQVMPTSRSGFAERLTRQRIEANPSRTAGAATVVGRADTVACTRLGFATVPRLAIPQRGKAWRDWVRRSALALTAGRCRGNRLPWRAV
jgi:hypothetical protein